MKLEIIITVFAFLLVGTISYSANAQLESIADHVVINEIETNPPGNDAESISEWVELYNPTSEEIYIGGWQIASTTGLEKTLTIPDGTTIKPDQLLKFSYQIIWFDDLDERVELLDESGNVIDETPSITDRENDFTSWQRPTRPQKGQSQPRHLPGSVPPFRP